MLRVSSVVCNPLIISTRVITGTGFIKCIPITFPDRLVKLAIFVMEIEDVLEASMALGFLTTLSSYSKTDFFTAGSSTTASTTKSAS